MSNEKVAVVTGAGRGIGASIALRLAIDGFAVAVNYAHSADDAQRVVDKIVAGGRRAVTIRADVSDAAQAEELIHRTTAELGAPTVLVNNAGINRSGSVRKQSPQDWDAVIGVNLSGAAYCTHFALPAMYEAGWGRVVFVTSPAGGRRPAAGVSAYSAAKAGLVGLARCLAQETARRGITVNAVMPGVVETDILSSGGERAVEAVTRNWPAISAESVASTVAFLVSDQAADVSGEEIGVWRGGPVGV
ncbi:MULTISPECIES: SDR family NAD(P)-dependent oxidoreductase [unclassified Mycolicibacterium]|uniref:SDR family oxidoreductase n=1 Tax=unclassified Mycolicibacterium TaxID=2636767 RepID=UPI00130879B6|nr:MULTISPECIES: SDR family NAD(P)-dependent oxidoreductase [unclassified Mycolicibacterium]MUL82300.1 SDR family oxidoreductase [Mycolicibacterium sp. CBMA 329]MUL88066.1 SDR family oxidoreductase [Mycolicibacterium sp. CBMA 331]MUM02396.1 SDR family oxidoreductase [Mycolicibacterium sp. CBMA 334]MUM24799.1 SDR family oxidoreductase [Mycolicibacterium sp. CBMA 295]MUM38363.1 SDR family oxidoreductase [Mycolicibacterium sp. CBMA 247]